MARPRVFVSSTYYDLKHLRSSLENFLYSLGFDAILSEKGRIAYAPDIPLDESCYREVGNTDIFVLIIGGRYGSEVSATKDRISKTFYERYNSITRGEYRSAVDRSVPMYILVERSVYAEYETYLKNKDNREVVYAHVDSVNIFHLLEEILAQPRNNPVFQFDRYADIEAWLREQWAGLFRELLTRAQAQSQLASLQAEVTQLAELNQTLRTYLEEIISRVAPAESQQLIETETKRLEDTRAHTVFLHNNLGYFLLKPYGLGLDQARELVGSAKTLDDLVENLVPHAPNAELAETVKSWSRDIDTKRIVMKELDKLRATLEEIDGAGVKSVDPKAAGLVRKRQRKSSRN